MVTRISQRINNDIFLWTFLLVCNVLWKFNNMLLYGTVLIACTLLVLSFSHPGKKEVLRHHIITTAEANLHTTACILPSKMYKIYSESKAVRMHATKANRELKEWFQLFLTSALDALVFSFMLQGKGTRYPLNRRLGGSPGYCCQELNHNLLVVCYPSPCTD
jgi:hypothetical protein